MEELRSPSAAAAGRGRALGGAGVSRLEEGVAQFARDVSGAGFDVPAWLEALQREVDRVESEAADDDEVPGPELPIPQIRLSREEVRRQVKAMSGQ